MHLSRLRVSENYSGNSIKKAYIARGLWECHQVVAEEAVLQFEITHCMNCTHVQIQTFNYSPNELQTQMHTCIAISEDESACTVLFGSGIRLRITISELPGSGCLLVPWRLSAELLTSEPANGGACTRCVLANWGDVLDEGLDKHSLCCCC